MFDDIQGDSNNELKPLVKNYPVYAVVFVLKAMVY